MNDKVCEIGARTLSALRVPASIAAGLGFCAGTVSLLVLLDGYMTQAISDIIGTVVVGIIVIAGFGVSVFFTVVCWRERDLWGPLYDKCRKFWGA